MDELIERLEKHDWVPIVREAAQAIRASAKREKRFREALQKIAFGPPHEGEVKHVLNTLVEIAQLALIDEPQE